MRVWAGLFLAVLLMAGAFIVAKPVIAGTTVDEVASELMCQCGCRLTLPACNMPECSVQKSMMEQIKVMLSPSDGQAPPRTKQEIIDYFLSTYGEEVLAAPTKQGFNLTAWLMPFAAIIAGLGFVYMVADQWVLRRGRRSAEEEAVEEEVSPSELSRYERRLRKELERHKGGS